MSDEEVLQWEDTAASLPGAADGKQELLSNWKLGPPVFGREEALRQETAGKAEPLLPESSDLAEQRPLVSVVVPCHNGAPWLARCLDSVRGQSWRPLELCFFDDASEDGSAEVLAAARPGLEAAGVAVRAGGGPRSGPRGCGFAKNRAVELSAGEFLCFLDADDEMAATRVEAQLREALARAPGVRERLLVGCGVRREPADAQPRFTRWANSLRSEEELLRQRFRECPLLMVTWFCHRRVFDAAGGFSEAGRGTPEDLLFFYAHCRGGGRLAKVPEALVTYRWHAGQTSTSSVPASAIWDARVAHVQQQLLDGLPSFSIWSAGRDGKRFFHSVSRENQLKVQAFFDVDKKKLAAGGFFDREGKRHVPVLHFSALSRSAGAGGAAARYLPVILLVKMDMYPEFEENLSSLELREGVDYWHFA